MTGTALARPIADIQKELHDLFAIAGDQPTREQRAAQCARMSELHDALNSKGLDDGSLFVSPLAAKRLSRKGMNTQKKNDRRTAGDVVTNNFGLTYPQQAGMLHEARNPEGFKAYSQRKHGRQLHVTSLRSLLIAVETVVQRSTPREKAMIREFCDLVTK